MASVNVKQAERQQEERGPTTANLGGMGPQGDGSNGGGNSNPCAEALQKLSAQISGYLKEECYPVLQESYRFEVEGVAEELEKVTQKMQEKKEQQLREKQLCKERIQALSSLIL